MRCTLEQRNGFGLIPHRGQSGAQGNPNRGVLRLESQSPPVGFHRLLMPVLFGVDGH